MGTANNKETKEDENIDSYVKEGPAGPFINYEGLNIQPIGKSVGTKSDSDCKRICLVQGDACAAVTIIRKPDPEKKDANDKPIIPQNGECYLKGSVSHDETKSDDPEAISYVKRPEEEVKYMEIAGN